MTEAFAIGLVTLAGVLVGYLAQFATSFRDRQERRHRLSREKFETFCDLIHASTLEVQELMGQVGYDALSYNPTSASRAHYLALLYFPELEDVTREYANGTALFRSYLYTSGFRPDFAATTGAQARMSDPEYSKKAERLQLQRTAVEEVIRKVVKKYTRA